MIKLSNSQPLAADRVIRAALSAELISADDVISRGVIVEQVGRSHSVYRLLRGGVPFAFIKSFGHTRGETDGNIQRERAILKLAETRDGVANLIPEELQWNEKGNELVTRSIPGISAWELDLAGGGKWTPEEAWDTLCASLLKPLAVFHRSTRDIAKNQAVGFPALASQTPWVLKIFSGDTPEDLWQTQSIQHLLSLASQNSRLVKGIREARRLWKPMCVIHADLKHDNIVLHRDKSYVIDWEMARVGDPAWDLAGLCSRFQLIAESKNGWGEREFKCLARLLVLYSDQSRLDVEVLTRRLLRYLGAWVLMAAIQHQSTLDQTEVSESCLSMLHKASSTFENIERLERRILDQISAIRVNQTTLKIDKEI